jgi:tagatose 6-phosphate kinase
MARVVVVTPNPAVDVTYHVDAQVIGDTVRVRRVDRRAGGKGLNVARVLHRLGLDATAVHPLGGVAGAWIEERLADDGIPSIAVRTSHETRTTVTVVDGVVHPTLLSEPGVPLDGATWERLTEVVATHCEEDGYLVVSGSFPPGTAAARVAALVTAGRAAGAFVVVDAGGPALLTAAEAGADLVKPNEAEVLQATGAGSLDEGLRTLLARGAGSVIVSRGAAGLLLASDPETRVAQPGVPGVTGNPTGAGDAATAGLVLALAAGLPASEALLSAAVVGAAAVLAPAAGEIDLNRLPELAARLGDRRPPPFPPTLPTASRHP